MIVDDSAVVRRAMRRSFEMADCSCLEAQNGLEAIEVVAQEKPDVIVLDLSMPKMNGLQAAPLLHKKLPHVPIILYTMHANQEIERLGRSAGIAAVVSKDEAMTRLVSEAYALANRSSSS